MAPCCLHWAPAWSQPLRVCQTTWGFGDPHDGPFAIRPTVNALFWFEQFHQTPQQHCYPKPRAAGMESERRDMSSDGEVVTRGDDSISVPQQPKKNRGLGADTSLKRTEV